MSSEDTSPEQQKAVQAIYDYAAELMIKGAPAPEIEQKLIAQGLDAESAGIVVSNLQQAKDNASRQAGRKNMLYGGLWCVGGTAVTIGTYLNASDGGGKYVVAWGAIVFGAIQFFRGLFQSSGG
jgi:hypothetical protein